RPPRSTLFPYTTLFRSRTRAGATVIRAARCQGSRTDTVLARVTGLRQNPVTEWLAGMDLGTRTASERTTGKEVTGTHRVAVTDRPAMGLRQDMDQILDTALVPATAVV